MYFWFSNRWNRISILLDVPIVLFYRLLHFFSELRALHSFYFNGRVFTWGIRSWKFDLFYFYIFFHRSSFVRDWIFVLCNHSYTSLSFSIYLSTSIIIPVLISFRRKSFYFGETLILPGPFFDRIQQLAIQLHINYFCTDKLVLTSTRIEGSSHT